MNESKFCDIDLEHVRTISDDLVKRMLEMHPGAGWTIWINFWMDNTFQVRCVSAKPENDGKCTMREFKWYNGEITYKERTEDQVLATS